MISMLKVITMLSTTLLYFVFILLTIGSVITEDDFNDVKYVGCYTTAYARDMDLGKSFYPFSWESCVLLCQSRGSRYAGLLQRKRTCFCGSYLVENSKLLSPKHCPYSCQGPRRRSCGGETSMTVYKLKDDTLPRVLVTTSNAINYVKKNQLIPLLTMVSGKVQFKLQCHYKNNEIYFVLDDTLVRSQYSTTTNSYTSPPTALVISGPGYLPFVVDWVSDKLYYYKSGNSIFEANLNGTSENELVKIKGIQYVWGMTVDPYNNTVVADRVELITEEHNLDFGCFRKLYYGFQDTSILKEFNLNNKLESTILTDSKLNYWSMVLDVHTQDIYVHSEPMKVMKKRVNESNLVVALYIANLGYQPTYMVVIDNNIILYVQKAKTEIYYVQYNNEPVPITLPTEQTVAGFLAMHEVIQAPTKKIVCSRTRCSHYCEYSPQSAARCVCPSDMQLDSTGRQCIQLRASRYSSEESECDDQSDCSARSYPEEESSDYTESESEDTEDYSESEDERSSNED